MKKILFVFGTRPEAIKMAPLILEAKKHVNELETFVCVTGQHREMLDQVLKLFNIKPDYDLNIMKESQDLYEISCNVLIGMRNILSDLKPNLVLVHGDTTTSTISALAAFYQKIAVAHIEAGLRTYNHYNPFPEEINRQLTGRIAQYHFAPTNLSKENLLSEGILEKNITVTGNTVIDALYMVKNKIDSNDNVKREVIKSLIHSGYDIQRLNDRKMVLITGHRRENFGDAFLRICYALKVLAEKYPFVDFIYPMHLNPNVRKPINDIFQDKKLFSNLFFIEPVDYLPFIYLMDKSTLILTDSGGIQEEAPSLGKPVLVMRETTERQEAIVAGTVKLVGTISERIISETSTLLDNSEYYQTMSNAINPYGDGFASKKIISKLISL